MSKIKCLVCGGFWVDDGDNKKGYYVSVVVPIIEFNNLGDPVKDNRIKYFVNQSDLSSVTQEFPEIPDPRGGCKKTAYSEFLAGKNMQFPFFIQ